MSGQDFLGPNEGEIGAYALPSNPESLNPDADAIAALREFVLPVVEIVPATRFDIARVFADMRTAGDSPARWLSALGAAGFMWAAAGFSLTEAVTSSVLKPGHPDRLDANDLTVMAAMRYN